MGDQKCHTTIPPVVHRFAEVRHPNLESHRQIIVPSSISSHAVRSDNERHGWAEFKGIPVDADSSTGHFDGSAATDSSGENFRFVEIYWQDILQKNQEHFASSVEQWSKALLNRLNDPEITPKDWLPEWAVPMFSSIVNTAIPLKRMIGFKHNEWVKTIYDEFLGDVHLYGDYTRTRGEAVRHFHAVLDKIIFFDFLDWRIQELTVSKLNHEEVRSRPYEKPEISVIAHSLGSVMAFDAIVYAYVKKHIRKASAENAEFSDSLPFTGYIYPSREEDDCYEKNTDRLERFVESVSRHIREHIRDEVRAKNYYPLFVGIYDELAKKGYAHDEIIEEMTSLNSRLENVFPIEKIVFRHFEKSVSYEYDDKVLKSGIAVNEVIELDAEEDRQKCDNRDEFRNAVRRDITEIISFVKEKIDKGDFAESMRLLEKDQKRFDKNVEEIVGEIDKVIKKDLTGKVDSYWKHFLDGISGLGENDLLVMNDENNPELNSSLKGGCNPLLLWRSCIKNFITLGSPIDKYLALWHQNYVHLGLTIKGRNTPDKWELPSVCQYDFAHIKRINHYNFCDEQDPVGHHLDLARMTKIYGKIFKDTDNAYRDVVFRRYGVPGLAHNKYWEDDELFRGILEEIIDRKDDNSSTFFVEDSFREKANAKKQGFMWAYFRIPAVAALVTTIFIFYAIFKADTYFSRIITLFSMILLWFMPSFLSFYKNRASVGNIDKNSVRLIRKRLFSKGIFSNLLWAAVEWRRILCLQSEGDSVDKKDSNVRISFQLLNERKPGSADFYWRWAWRVMLALVFVVFLGVVYIFIINGRSISGIVHWKSVIVAWEMMHERLFYNKVTDIEKYGVLLKVLLSVLLYFVVYILVMFYEIYLFVKAKREYYKKRKGWFWQC